MGYNVKIIKSTAIIPPAHLERAYIQMCALNITHDAEKCGGRYSNGKRVEAWFSWMDPNYPETCSNAEEILVELGFDVFSDQLGIHITGYDSKSGQEELFLNSIQDLVYGSITWIGEDEIIWEWSGGFDRNVPLLDSPITSGDKNEN